MTYSDEAFTEANRLLSDGLSRDHLAEIITQRDNATAELEGIAAFDGGEAGDVACRFLIDASVWTARMQRMDGTPLALPPHVPHRGSDVETYIKNARERAKTPSGTPLDAYYALDRLLDDYRLHADTGTPLTEVAPDGGDPESQGAHT